MLENGLEKMGIRDATEVDVSIIHNTQIIVARLIVIALERHIVSIIKKEAYLHRLQNQQMLTGSQRLEVLVNTQSVISRIPHILHGPRKH